MYRWAVVPGNGWDRQGRFGETGGLLVGEREEQMGPDIELVVTDLDGTLWEVDTEVHARTRNALGRLAAAGIPVLVATGRRARSTREPLSAIGLAPPAVLLNGSLGIDLSSGVRFHRGGFDSADATSVLDIFADFGIHPCVHVDDDTHPVRLSVTPSTHPDHVSAFRDDMVTDDLTTVVLSEHVLGFSVLGLPDAQAQALGVALAAVARAHVDRDRQYPGSSLTVAPPTQSKWDGVGAFCAGNGLDPGAVLALGDGPNDVELLANAAIALVPEDGHDTARAVADHVIGRAAHGGWADVLDLLGISPD